MFRVDMMYAQYHARAKSAEDSEVLFAYADPVRHPGIATLLN